MAFIIIRGISNKIISSALLVILIFGFVINEDFSSKHKHGFRREFVTVIMSVLALVIYFIGKALGTFDGIKMSNSQKSAWGYSDNADTRRNNHLEFIYVLPQY